MTVDTSKLIDSPPLRTLSPAHELSPAYLPPSSAHFDGMQLMEVAHSTEFNSIELSISLWVYLLEDSTNSYRTIFRKATSAADMTPTLMLLPNDRRLHVRVSTSQNAANGFDSTAVVPLRRWTHIAYVLRGGATLTLYVNGVKDCPVLGGNLHGVRCPPGGSTFSWDEGAVSLNEGPLYVGGDPFMPGTPMFVDNLKVRLIFLLLRSSLTSAVSPSSLSAFLITFS